MVSSFSEKPLKSRSLLLSEEEDITKNNTTTATNNNNNSHNHKNPSFRVYYAVASGSVPFVWESEPGTPKKPVADFNRPLLVLPPPLTPPPSYQYSTMLSTKKSPKKFSLFKAMLLKLGRKRNRTAWFASPGSSF